MATGGAASGSAGTLDVGGLNTFAVAGATVTAAPFNRAWWSYSPSVIEKVTVDTFASDVGGDPSSADTLLYVLRDSTDLAHPLVSNDDAGGGTLSQVEFIAWPGSTYYVVAATFGSDPGSLLTYSLTVSAIEMVEVTTTVVPDPVSIVYVSAGDGTTPGTTPNPFHTGFTSGADPVWDTSLTSFSFTATSERGDDQGAGFEGYYQTLAVAALPDSVLTDIALNPVSSITATFTASYDDDHAGVGSEDFSLFNITLGGTLTLTNDGASEFARDAFHVPGRSTNTYTSSTWALLNTPTLAGSDDFTDALASQFVSFASPIVGLFRDTEPTTEFSTYSTVYAFSLAITHLEPRVSVGYLPPLRLTNRTDRFASARSLTGNSQSRQGSNRLTGYL